MRPGCFEMIHELLSLADAPCVRSMADLSYQFDPEVYPAATSSVQS
jgi:hypothetical protein